jgi:hypothetical protein
MLSDYAKGASVAELAARWRLDSQYVRVVQRRAAAALRPAPRKPYPAHNRDRDALAKLVQGQDVPAGSRHTVRDSCAAVGCPYDEQMQALDRLLDAGEDI